MGRKFYFLFPQKYQLLLQLFSLSNVLFSHTNPTFQNYRMVFRWFKNFNSLTRVVFLFLCVVLGFPPPDMFLRVDLTICTQCYLYVVAWELVNSSQRQGKKSRANAVPAFFFCGYLSGTRKAICATQMYFVCGRYLLVRKLCLLMCSPSVLFSTGCDYTSLKFHPLDLSFQK